MLHTWDQTLKDHFHLHCLIPAGAPSFDHSRWLSACKNFLFPVTYLSRVFRAGYSVTEELPFLFLIANMWVGVLRVQHVLSSHRSFGNLSEA